MGLKINYFYSLTPRQFFNHVKGWSDLRDAESKERMIFTRRLMYSNLAPWTKGLKETDIWPFDFEKDNNDRKDHEILKEELQQTLDYWDEIDRRRELKATEK